MLKDKLKYRLKECRLACDYSQQQVAEVLNMHRSTYSYYESGKTEPSLDNICMLAKIFGVSLDYLLDLEIPGGDMPVMGDPGYDDEFRYLRKDAVQRLGDLTDDEKSLIMRFRLMTDKQRRELLEMLGSRGGESSGQTKKKQ